jgi:hypothetical protein
LYEQFERYDEYFPNYSKWVKDTNPAFYGNELIINFSKNRINYYIESDYNKLLQYPKTDSNKADIERSLAQIYEVISDYDEKIKDLAEDKLEAIDDLNEYISDTEVHFIPNKPIDPNRWDFLLTIK